MLAKASVILGLFVAVSLGQAPDCRMVSRLEEWCCMNINQPPPDEEMMKCRDENKVVLKSADPSCAMDTCIMKKKHMIGSDNKINREVFIKYIKQNLNESSPSLETYFEKCVAETETSDCAPVKFLACFYSALMRDCPSTLWLKTEYCTTLKKYFVDCPNAKFL